MKGTLYLKTAPTTEPVTTAEAKAHIRVDISDDDTLIAGLVTAARRWIEDVYGIKMMTQTWNYYLDQFPSDSVIELPVGPVLSIASVKYTSDAGVTSTLSASDYDTDLVSLPARISLKSSKSWPTATLKTVNGVDVEFVAGYHATQTTTTSVPEVLKLAIKMLVEHWYEHRGAVTELTLEQAPLAIQALLANFTMYQRGN